MKTVNLFSCLVVLLFLSGLNLQASAQVRDAITSDADIGPIFVKFNKEGIAKFTLKIPAKGKRTFALDGKTFKQVEIRQLKGPKMKYKLYRGSSLLSYGHTTGVIKNIKSDGRSTYYLSCVAEDVIDTITLQWRSQDAIPGR